MGKQTEEKGYYVFVMDSKVIIGDLYFSYNPELDFDFEKGYEIWYEHMRLGETEKYEEFAKDAMARHYQFYEELDNEEYVTRDSVLSCIYGTHSRKLDLLVDHGVKAPTVSLWQPAKTARREKIYMTLEYADALFRPISRSVRK